MNQERSELHIVLQNKETYIPLGLNHFPQNGWTNYFIPNRVLQVNVFKKMQHGLNIISPLPECNISSLSESQSRRDAERTSGPPGAGLDHTFYHAAPLPESLCPSTQAALAEREHWPWSYNWLESWFCHLLDWVALGKSLLPAWFLYL